MKKLIVLLLTYVLLLISCSPLVQVSSGVSQTPELGSSVFITSDGSRLPVRKWIPDNEPAAIIISLHGFNDYSAGISAPASYFQQSDILTIAYDQRGFGETQNRGVWAGTDLLLQDVNELVKLVKLQYPDIPLFLMGHSMGAAVIIGAADKYELNDVEALLLIAPAVWGGDSFNWFYRSMLWLGAHTIPWKNVSGRGLVRFSDNEEMIRQFRADENVISNTRLDSVFGLTHLMDHAQQVANKLSKPVTLFYGLNDEVIPVDAICLFVSQLKTRVQLKFYPLGYHFLLRDLNSAIVRKDVTTVVTDLVTEIVAESKNEIKPESGDINKSVMTTEGCIDYIQQFTSVTGHKQ